MTPNKTRLLLALALAATLVAAWFAPEEGRNDIVPNLRPAAAPSAVTERTPPRESDNRRRKREEAVEVLPIRPRGEAGEEGAQLFAPMSWMPPRSEPVPVEVIAKPVVVEPVETPVAPPLPFQALGRYTDQGRSLIFLLYMDQSLAVTVGDTIADSYRVEKIEDSALMLRYLPLNELQSLDIGRIQ